MKILVRSVVAVVLICAVACGLRPGAAPLPERPEVLNAPVCECSEEEGKCRRTVQARRLSCEEYARKLMSTCRRGYFDPDCFTITHACWQFDECSEDGV